MSEVPDFDDIVQFRALFDWTPDFTPKEIADRQRRQLPVIAVVSSGYDGCDGMHEFALDEVYCIVDLKKQKRLVVTDSNHRFISIPFDYPVKFHTVASNGKIKNKVRTLSQIFSNETGEKTGGGGGGGEVGGGGGEGEEEDDVGNVRLMLEDNRAIKFNECASSGSMDQMGCLEYNETYDERYLVCHPLQNSEILADVVLIPVYVPISLTIARGFSAFVTGDFVDWMTKIKASVKALDATSIKPCMDIVVFNESPASDYVTMTPVSLFQHNGNETETETETASKEAGSADYQNVIRCRERKKSKDARFAYQPPANKRGSILLNIPEQSSPKPSPKLPSRTRNPPGILPAPGEAGPDGGRTPRTAHRSPNVTPSRSSSCSPGLPPRSPKEGGGGGGESGPKVAPRSPGVTFSSSSFSSSRAPARPPPVPRRIGSLDKTCSGQSSKSSGDNSRSKVKLGSTFRQSRSCSDVPTEFSSPAPPPPPQLTRGEGKPCSKVSPTGNATRFVKEQPPNYVRKHTGTSTHPPPPPLPPPKSSNGLRNGPEKTQLLVAKQFNVQDFASTRQQPVATEAPEVKKGGTAEAKPDPAEEQEEEFASSSSSSSSGGGRKWKRIAEIPTDLDARSLSVEELCLCLDLLKMERFSQMFRDQMVDGTLLMDLPDDVLCDQFGFNVFEIKKLMNFARHGWRPKTE